MKRAPKNINLENVTDSVAAVTLQEFKDAVKLPLGQTLGDADTLETILAVQSYVESYIGFVITCRTVRQTQDRIDSIYKLFAKPLLSVTSIQYISGFEADTLLTVSPTLYAAAGDSVAARGAWPSHRGFQSWITTYKVGLYNVTDESDPIQTAAARAACPSTAKRAIFQFAGHLFENREGQGPISKYEVSQKASGNLPPNVSVLLEPLLKRRFKS